MADDIIKARSEFVRICEAFGVDVPEVGSEGKMLDAILAGRLVYDPATCEIEYKLAAPVAPGTAAEVSAIRFGDPTGKDLEQIHDGVMVESRSGATSINLADSDRMTSRAISIVGHVNAGLVDRIKRRDLAVLSEVFSVLGFFG